MEIGEQTSLLVVLKSKAHQDGVSLLFCNLGKGYCPFGAAREPEKSTYGTEFQQCFTHF